MKPNNKINNKYFTNLKCNVPKHNQTNLIYKIPCKDCPKAYIGETLQALEHRVQDHQRDVRAKNDKTALAIHAKNEGHNLNFDEVTILDRESKTAKRKLLEAAHISIVNNTMNFKSDSKGLNKYYAAVFKEIS